MKSIKYALCMISISGLFACGGSTGGDSALGGENGLGEENQRPVANEQSLSTQEDTNVVATLGGVDSDNDELVYRIISQPVQGTLSGVIPNLIYTPNANYHGEDSFSFVVNDGEEDSEAAVINISISAVNDAPSAEPISLSVNQDESKEVTLTGQDVEESELNYQITSSPNHGVLSGDAPNLTYTPNTNFQGEDNFSYVTNDGELDSLPSMVNINVVPVVVSDNMATLSWMAPTSRTDNSPLSILQLGGYKVYSGSSENNLTLIATITDNSITEYTATNLENGVHYFAVLAFDSNELESDLSNVDNKTINQ